MVSLWKDTDTIDPRDLEVINQLNNVLTLGVTGIRVSHLVGRNIAGYIAKLKGQKSLAILWPKPTTK